MDVMCALIGVYSLQIHGVSDDMVLIRDAVAAMHVTRHSGDIERFTAVVAFHQRDIFNRAVIIIHESTHTQCALQAKGNFSLHIGELLLDKLVRGEGSPELLAFQRVVAGRVPTEFG